MKKIIVLFLLFILCSCSWRNTINYRVVSPYISNNSSMYDLKIYQGSDEIRSLPPFDTEIFVLVYDFDKSKKENILRALDEEITYDHILFDRHYNYSLNGKMVNNLKTINDSYNTNQTIKVDPKLFDILKLGVELTTLTEGKFNLGIGALSTLWTKYQDLAIENNFIYQDPTDEELNQARVCTPTATELKNILIFDEDESTIRFNKLDGCENKVELSLASFGKGYAVEELSKNDTIKKIKGYISGSMSSIKTLSNHYNNKPWTFLLSNPAYRQAETLSDYEKYSNLNAYDVALELKGAFDFATSGDYNNFYFNLEGDIRHHILDPETGYHSTYYRQVSVVTSNAIFGDMLSTTLMLLSIEEGLTLIDSLIEKGYIEYAYPIYTIEKDGQMVYKTTKEMLGGIKKSSYKGYDSSKSISIIEQI